MLGGLQSLVCEWLFLFTPAITSRDEPYKLVLKAKVVHLDDINLTRELCIGRWNLPLAIFGAYIRSSSSKSPFFCLFRLPCRMLLKA